MLDIDPEQLQLALDGKLAARRPHDLYLTENDVVRTVGAAG